MKLLSKVVWAEGMYLAPHHFQAQNRYFEEAVHFATAGLWNDAYGLADYQLDTDAIRNGTVALLQARGIFEDGLAFDMPDSDPLPAAYSIVEEFPPTASHLVLSLSVPRWVSDGRNCSLTYRKNKNPFQRNRWAPSALAAWVSLTVGMPFSPTDGKLRA